MTCGDLEIVRPEDAVHEGCPILTKRRLVVLAKGVCSTVEWPMRWSDGTTADLSSCFPVSSVSTDESVSIIEEHSVKVRIADCDMQGDIYEVDGEVTDAEGGLVQFQLPAEVANGSGIYTFQIGIVNQADVPIFVDSGLLSVERSLWGDTTQRGGPPSINEIRLHIRDTAVENDLLQDVEFDNAEIMQAIVRPVLQWNETPPDLRGARYNCRTFPFHYYWVEATVAQLLQTAAHHYMRNDMQSSHGGLVVNDKAKYQPYLTLFQLYSSKWESFIVTKKAEFNMKRAWGTFGSPYSG